MSESTNLFVRGSKSLTGLIEDVASILGARFAEAADDRGVFIYREAGVIVEIYEHSFDNDRDMDFQSYPFHIGVWATSPKTWEGRVKHREELAKKIFEALARTDRYDIMMVHDLQRKLAIYSRNQRPSAG